MLYTLGASGVSDRRHLNRAVVRFLRKNAGQKYCVIVRDDFLERLAGLCNINALKVYAWALMGNHFHLLIRTGTKCFPIYNRRHKQYGHLFQNRYKSIICEDDPYLIGVDPLHSPEPVKSRFG